MANQAFRNINYWWLVRGTLVVDFRPFVTKFWEVVGTYK